MKNTFKKIAASVMAVASLAVGIVGMSANAVAWEASHVSGGAPGSASKTAYITVWHQGNGANANCNYNSHSNANAVTGYTYINCTNYTMAEKKITNTGSVVCNPSVGSPTTKISVGYRVSAYTPTAPDTFWSKGNITER